MVVCLQLNDKGRLTTADSNKTVPSAAMSKKTAPSAAMSDNQVVDYVNSITAWVEELEAIARDAKPNASLQRPFLSVRAGVLGSSS